MVNLTSVRRASFWGYLTVVWAAMLIAGLSVIFAMFRELNAESYRFLGWRQIVYNAPVVAAVFLLTKLFMRSRWLAWKPSDIIFGAGSAGKIGDSLLVKAMRVRWLGPFVTVLLVANLPIIANLEEFIFRNGTIGWQSAVFRSLLFGLAHLTANVPIGACLAVSLTGFWFTYWYFQGNLEMAAKMHFGYILIVVGLSAPAILWQHLKGRPS
jgi:hypothetical protein